MHEHEPRLGVDRDLAHPGRQLPVHLDRQPANGPYRFVAVAIDNAGNPSDPSGPTPITVHNFSSQTITFTSSAPTATVGGSPYNVTATASSGLPVVFTSATTPVCTVSGSTVSFIAAGTCTINANQAGNGDYLAAPQAQQSFTVAAPIGVFYANPGSIVRNQTTRKR